MTPLSVLLELSLRERRTSDDCTHALGAKAVKNAKPGPGVQKLSDGGSMFLQVAASGTKSWLADARSAHRAARWLVARGIHPLGFATEQIETAKSESRARWENSFAAVGDRWMAATDGKLSARTVKHRRLTMYMDSPTNQG